mmetsp:Transcript_29957/g.54573  ORF Transcript_29957/g.54573 Transcript_29957/m.54573 type:complete len:257 (-) Transcript_29957:203-973(-)
MFVGGLGLKPLHSLTILPLSLPLGAGLCYVASSAMLLALSPLSNVATAVWPMEVSLTILQVIDVLTVVNLAIGPLEHATAMHSAVLPLTFVASAIGPQVLTLAMRVVLEEGASETRAIGPFKQAFSLFHAIDIAPLVAGSVWPHLHSLSMLTIIHPLAYVFRPIGMAVDTIAMGLPLLPLAFIHITISMCEFAMSLHLVCLPLTFKPCAIRPHLDSMPMPFSTNPFACVRGTTLEFVLRPQLLLLNIHHFSITAIQ